MDVGYRILIRLWIMDVGLFGSIQGAGIGRRAAEETRPGDTLDILANGLVVAGV
jgi:hypothetical protein